MRASMLGDGISASAVLASAGDVRIFIEWHKSVAHDLVVRSKG
jgi:hypothetical protein